jgi:hypothetical protein
VAWRSGGLVHSLHACFRGDTHRTTAFARGSGRGGRALRRRSARALGPPGRRKQGAVRLVQSRPIAYPELSRRTRAAAQPAVSGHDGRGRVGGRKPSQSAQPCGSGASRRPYRHPMIPGERNVANAIVSSGNRGMIKAVASGGSTAWVVHACCGHGEFVAAFTRLRKPGSSASRSPTRPLLPTQPLVS